MTGVRTGSTSARVGGAPRRRPSALSLVTFCQGCALRVVGSKLACRGAPRVTMLCRSRRRGPFRATRPATARPYCFVDVGPAKPADDRRVVRRESNGLTLTLMADLRRAEGTATGPLRDGILVVVTSVVVKPLGWPPLRAGSLALVRRIAFSRGAYWFPQPGIEHGRRDSGWRRAPDGDATAAPATVVLE